VMNFPSSIAKSRKRRQIRAKIDDVSRLVGSCFRSANTDCAVITKDGDILTGKGGSTRPFIQLVPKIRALRRDAASIADALAGCVPRVLHVRGMSWMAAVYSLGPHSLVVLTPAPLKTSETSLRELDAVLTQGDVVQSVVDELEHLVLDI
jgi:hypothetical protein